MRRQRRRGTNLAKNMFSASLSLPLSLSCQLVLVQCGGDESSARVWSNLRELDLSVNAIEALGHSLVSAIHTAPIISTNSVTTCTHTHVSEVIPGLG